MTSRLLLSLFIFSAGCSCEDPSDSVDAGVINRRRPPRVDAGFTSQDTGPLRPQITVQVRLDGEPVEGAIVLQGGTGLTTRSDVQGLATLTLDPTVVGDKTIVASHPEARIGHLPWRYATEAPSVLDLVRFNQQDNPDYQFQDPGEPGRRPSTNQCGHCHVNINDDWHASPHRSSASNPYVQDLYAGTSHALNDADSCSAAGGRWAEARGVHTAREFRCFLGRGQLINQAGCVDADCLEQPTQTGRCADCHAPAINGQLGGRDLLEAKGSALKYGVSCDICHRVESLADNAAPGVGHRLKLHRPSEVGDESLGAGGLLPITFGPNHDSPNIRMGSVQRDHFQNGKICSGCHQYDQHEGQGVPAPNAQRWPNGKLPIQSTYSEWKDGVFGDQVACNACHMPPDADVLNGADHQLFAEAETGVVAGWYRPAGATRRHAWFGPRQPESRLLELAATLMLTKTQTNTGWRVDVDTINSGCGHALPTGEPQRQVLLLVELSCDDTQQALIGGDVMPSWAGAIAQRPSQQDWQVWPAAQVGDRLAIIRLPGGYRSYQGVGAFADDRWNNEAKGIAIETAVGMRRIVAIDDEGRIQTDTPLPAGDRAYLLRGEHTLAGMAGVGFARVTVSADGTLGVHHVDAVDLQSDNRLMPQGVWRSSHLFEANCAEPVARARLLHRNFFYATAQSKAWSVTDRLITEVRR